MRLVPTAAVLAVIALALAGCGGGGSGGAGSSQAKIDWNLAQRHDVAAVHWPAGTRDLDATELKPVDSVRIALPGGRSFEAAGNVAAVFLHREGERVDEITIDSVPMSTDDAYKLASKWAREWNLDTRRLDEWHAERVAQRKRGKEDKSSTAEAANNKEFVGGQDDPNPSVEVQYSFRDDKPSIVALDFFWPRPKSGENGTPQT